MVGEKYGYSLNTHGNSKERTFIMNSILPIENF